jgi:WD40 repeat protein
VITRVQFSSDGNLLCCSCDDNIIRIYHKEKGPYDTLDFRSIDGPDSTITGMHCSPVPNILVLFLVHCSHHAVCRLIDLDTLAVRHEIHFPAESPQMENLLLFKVRQTSRESSRLSTIYHPRQS